MKDRFIILFLCAILSLPAPAFAGLSWKELNLPADSFPASSEYHTVKGFRVDPSAPGFLIFSVSGSQEEAEVEGLADLKKWVYETAVIEKLNKEKSGSSGVADGAAESIKGTGRGLKNLILHPVASAKGFGKAAEELGDKIGGAFEKKEEGEKGDSFLSSSKRQIAQKLGVDVYSRNPRMQEKLDSLAKQQMGGRSIVMVATFLVPFGLVASAVMTASNINDSADQLVNDNDRADLYALNKDGLLALGFSLSQIKEFLNHSYYTPRELTYIRFYLEKLYRLQGAKALLDKAIQTTENIPAQKFLHEMQIAADSMATLSDAKAVRIVPEGLILERRDAVVLVTGYDLLDLSPLGDQVVKRVLDTKKQLGKGSAEIWNGGAVTSRFSTDLVRKGIQIRRMCLFGTSAAVKDPNI